MFEVQSADPETRRERHRTRGRDLVLSGGFFLAVYLVFVLRWLAFR
jgi:hypothetical protein